MSKHVDKILAGLAGFKNTSDGWAMRLKLNLAELVIKGMRDKGWSHADLAKRAGLPEEAIENIVLSDRNCSLERIAEIMWILELPVELRERKMGDATDAS